MKKVKLSLAVISFFLITSCTEEEQQQVEKKEDKIVVSTATLKSETRQELTHYFGALNYAKQTVFRAQQSGVVSEINVATGSKVSTGKKLVQYPPIHHQLQIEQTGIELKQLQKDYKRQQALYKVGAVPENSVEALKVQVAVQSKLIEQLQKVNSISAPFNGVVTNVWAKIGQELQHGDPIFSLAATNKAEVEFYVTGGDIGKIVLNSPIYMTKNGKRIVGKVSEKSIQLDEQRKAYLVKGIFENEEFLFVGNTIELGVEIGAPKTSIWIPSNAFRKSQRRFYVFLLKGGKAIKQEVLLGQRNEHDVEVIKGLEVGDKLIVAGIDKLSHNTSVEVTGEKKK